MSWLFDRLCEIAVADEVEVVLAAALDGPRRDDGADLAEVLVRAAAVPQLTCWVRPRDQPPRAAAGPVLRADDLDGLTSDEAVAAVASALRDQRSVPGSVVQVRGDTVSLHAADGEHDGRHDLRHRYDRCDRRDRRLVVATDAGGRGEYLAEAGTSGLAIAVGGAEPAAQVRVDDVAGVVAIVDALVTLRVFAFGGQLEAVADLEPPMALRRVV
jgi:hypothetical protein